MAKTQGARTLLRDLRRAVADYMASEGCSCCSNPEKHSADRERLGKLLNVPKYEDGSGHDFPRYRTTRIKP